MTETLTKEIAYWTRLRDEAEWDEKIKIDGALAELNHYTPESVTANYLRERYRMRLRRSKTPTLRNRALDLVARNRAVKACEAIIRLGKLASKLDK